MIKSINAARRIESPTPQAGATATRTSATATGATPALSKARFENAAETLRYLKQDYIPGLTQQARAFEAAHGQRPKDQDFPTEIIRMVPPHPKLPSLLIVGGMGPLAGAQAMEAALTQFGDSREIVLLQLCNVPDRTEALDEDARQQRRSDAHLQVVEAMKQGFLEGESALECAWVGTGPAVVACNTAHNFAPGAFAAYQKARDHKAGLELHSLVQCVVSELSRTQPGQEAPVVILGTNGTLKTRLYIHPLEAKGVQCAVPAPEAQQMLMDAIYQGVKAFSEDETVKNGNALFLAMKARGQIVEGKPFVILAGCTEVPEIVNGDDSSDDEDSSSDISDSEVRDAARWALKQGMKEGVMEGPRSGTTFVAPPTCTQRWANTAWETVKIVVPLSFAACVMYTTAAADLPVTAVALSTGIAGAGVYQVFAARFGREQFKEGLRVAFTQLSTQFVTTMSLRFGLEQLALHVDPTLTATGQFNGTHFDAFAGNLTGNFTEAYAIDHERVFPGGTAWMSLAVLGLPAALFLQSFLIHPGHATTTVDSLVDRLRFDASQGPGKVRARWSNGQDKLIRNGAKAGIGMTGLMVVGGLLGAGHRKLALRILANASLVMSAARARDFTNMLMRGVSPGSPATVSWPDGGWARQQQVRIPGAVLDALERACTDPDTGELNQKMKRQAEQLLKVWYRNLFIGGRVSSMPIYTGAGVFGLFIMRDFFSPAVGGIFAKDFYEALSVAVPFSLGTAFAEAVEDPMHAYAISVWAGMNSMPFEIARAPRHPRGKMADNLRQLSFTALLPGHNIVRGLFPSRYQASTVNEDGVVTLSLDDRLELNAGIRAGQNLATMMILTAAGASTDPQFKQMLFLLGVALNGATHFRGNVAAQILESGREARLLYDCQDEILAHQGEHDRTGPGGHAPRDEDSDGDIVIEVSRRRNDGVIESIVPALSRSEDSSRTNASSGDEVEMPPLPAVPSGPGVATQ